MKSRKAVIGPLGDDIPSIFPIIAAVMLFTGTVLYALTLVDEKNAYLEIRRGAMTLSYAVTEKGVTDADGFGKMCEEKLKPLGTAKNVNFLVTVKRYCGGISVQNLAEQSPETYGPYFVDESEAEGDTWLYCTNYESMPTGTAFPQPARNVLMNYPSAVPCPDADSPTRGIGMINVIAWR